MSDSVDDSSDGLLPVRHRAVVRLTLATFRRCLTATTTMILHLLPAAAVVVNDDKAVDGDADSG